MKIMRTIITLPSAKNQQFVKKVEGWFDAQVMTNSIFFLPSGVLVVFLRVPLKL